MARSQLLPALTGQARTPGSGDRLRALLQDRTAAPFQWGVNDCCLFAADAVRAQLGIDPAAGLRGRYATAREAERVLRQCGGLEGIARSALGEPLRAPMLACVGDVGIIDEKDSGRDILAICIGEWWTLPTRDGLGLMPLDNARMAWKVGCG
jgi:hypothetical protein